MSSYKCGICNKTLGKAFLNFGGTRYHYDCFVCFKCGTPLKDDVYAKGGRIYCKADVPKGPVPEPQAPPPSAYTYTGEDGGDLPPPPPDEEDGEDGSERKCMVCKGKMNVESWVVVDDQVVHKKCFFCSACGMGLKGVPYYVKGGALVCEHDYKWSKGNDDRSWMCAGCHKIIHDGLISAMSKKWHKECLKCCKSGCKNGAQFQHNEKGKEYLYCSTHIPEGAEIEVQTGTKEETPEEEAVVEGEEEQDLPMPTRPSVAPGAYKSGGTSAYKSGPSQSVASSSSPYKSASSNPYKSKPSVVTPPPAPEEEDEPPTHDFGGGDEPAEEEALPEPEPEAEPEPEPEPEPVTKGKKASSKAKTSSKKAAKEEEPDSDDEKKGGGSGEVVDTRKLDSAKKQLATRDSAKARLKAQLGDDAPKYKPSYKVAASKFDEEQQKTGKPKKK